MAVSEKDLPGSRASPSPPNCVPLRACSVQLLAPHGEARGRWGPVFTPSLSEHPLQWCDGYSTYSQFTSPDVSADCVLFQSACVGETHAEFNTQECGPCPQRTNDLAEDKPFLGVGYKRTVTKD